MAVGALAGVVVDLASFHVLALACLVIALAIGVAAVVLRGPANPSL